MRGAQAVSVEVKLRIEPRTAILARKATIGVVSVMITEENLADLPDAVLEALARVVESGEVLEGPHVEDATFTSVLSGLAAKLAREEETKAAARRLELDNRAAEARAAEEEIARRRHASERALRHEAAITRWIEENCDDEMVDRRHAGFLKDEEVIEEAAHQLFEITEDEHVTLKAYQACDCEKGCAGSVQFRVEPADHLDSSQFAALARVKEGAPQGATVTPQARKAVCPECQCPPIVRMTALVQLPWNGWMLQKVYSLG